MKATIDIPDELYRRVKAQAALQGRAVRDVTTELFRRWLGDEPDSPGAESPEGWLARWLALADEAASLSSAGPTARENLDADRNRLEPGG